MVLLGPDEAPVPPTVAWVVVHPIDTAAHPGENAGYRWAVMVGQCPPSDTSRCANAGRKNTRDDATLAGDRHGATAVVALRLAGLNVAYGNVIHLDHDPRLPGDDRVTIV
jgi:2-phospho-L-lactate guanylyltransferase (CobY/MobA/RfbA family)